MSYEKVLSKTIRIPFTLANVERIAKEHTWQVREVAEKLRGKTVEETTKNIWLFIRKHIGYDEIEGYSDDKEYLRTPTRMFLDGIGDCDCYTITISSILMVLGIDHVYRVVSYDKEDPKGWQHIYPVAKDENGREFPIDCVPEVFTYNYELVYINKFDTHITMTKQLGNAKNIFASVFTGFNEGDTVERKPFGLMILQRILEALKMFYLSLPMEQAPAKVLDEIVLIDMILQVWNNREQRLEALKIAASKSLIDPAIYTKIALESEKFENSSGFDTVKNILQGQALGAGKTLGFADILSAAGGIVTSIFGDKAQQQAADAQIKVSQQNAAAASTTANANVEIAKLNANAEADKNATLLKIAALQAATTQAAARTTPTDQPNTNTPTDQNNNKKMWYWIGGGVLFILFIVFLFVAFSKPKSQTMGRGKKKKSYKKRAVGKATPKKRKRKPVGNTMGKGRKPPRKSGPPRKKKGAKKKK
jgi:hypothetical protein